MSFKNKVNISVLILLLSVIFLLFVIGAYADDNNNIITNGTDIVNTTTVNNTNNNGVREVDVHNWNELKAAVDNLTAHPCEKLVINLEDGDYKIDTKQIDVKSGQNIEINGNGQTINCNQKHFMDIAKGGTITINNLQVQNAKVKVDGGAIWNKGGNLIVHDSTFNNNQAGNDGGAIYNTGTLTVTGSTFTKNYAGGDGGAIKSTGNNKPLICTNCKFINNIANDNGGAIDCRVLQIKNCVFTKNDIGSCVEADHNGGAINCNDLNECTGCNFTGNTAGKNGGAIAIMEKAGTNVIKDCIFKNNKANDEGGAIYVDRFKAHITIIHNQFIDNSAHVRTAGNNVYNNGHYGKIEHNYFPNKSQNSFIEYRAFPFHDEEHVDNSPFYNLDDYYKGKIDKREVNVHNYDELKNAVDNLTSDCKTLVINLEDGDYKINTQQIDVKSGQNVVINGNGHTIDCNQKHFMDITTGGNVTINNLQVQNAKVKVDGGAIWNKGGTLTVTGSTFNDNQAGTNGGAIYNTGTLTVTGSTFNNNKADQDGGAICGVGGKVNPIQDCTFKNNIANSDQPGRCEGGAIRCTGNNNPLIVTDCQFIGNRAEDGGAIDCRVLQIRNCVFTQNKASNAALSCYGGAVNCNDLNECNGCNFTSNTADNGGAIAIMEKAGINEVKNCIFKSNKVDGRLSHGGAIFVNKVDAHISLVHNQFIDNFAKKSGDNVYNWGNYGLITRNYFPNEKQNVFNEFNVFGGTHTEDAHPFYNLDDYYKWKG